MPLVKSEEWALYIVTDTGNNNWLRQMGIQEEESPKTQKGLREMGI